MMGRRLHRLRNCRLLFLGFIVYGMISNVIMISAMDVFLQQSPTNMHSSASNFREGSNQGAISDSPIPSWTPCNDATIESRTEAPKRKRRTELTQRMSTWMSELRISTKIVSDESKRKLSQLGRQLLNNKKVSKGFPHGASQELLTTTRLIGGAEQDSTSLNNGEGGEHNGAATGDKKPPASGAFLGNLDTTRRKSLKLPKTIVEANGPVLKKFKSVADAVQQTGRDAVPPFVTTLSLIYTANKGMSVLSLYGLALLGASCGFHLFLHFITIGYALGIGLPLTVALYVYKKNFNLSRPTFFHSLITVLWSFRMLAFFLWREYVSWPALHEKVVEIQRRMTIPFASKLLCWLVYSFFYFAMMSMSWSRLQQGEGAKWGIVGRLGLLMQVVGLGLETIADLQKNGFKSRNRHAWCNVGVWKWSTHPNYFGEGLFWWGTYLGHGFHSLPQTLIATVGLGFIMSVLKGSTRSLSTKHLEKYGDQPEYFEFQRTHSIWGPKHWWWWLHGMEHLSEPVVVAYSVPGNTTTINTNNSSSTEETTFS